MKTIAIIQARSGSTRLPNKIFIKIKNKTILEHVINRIKQSKEIEKIIVATTKNKDDDKVEEFCRKKNIEFFRGSEENVLSRFIGAAKKHRPKTILRVTSDNPLIDPEYIDLTIKAHNKNNNEYTACWTSLPYGLGCEVVSFRALTETRNLTKEKKHLEHVTLFIRENPERFKIEILKFTEELANFHNKYRLTLDTKEDLKVMEIIFNAIYSDEKQILTEEILNFINKNPKIIEINNKEIAKDIKQVKI